jgi:uncharacterized membrane protein (UPF0127 family)
MKMIWQIILFFIFAIALAYVFVFTAERIFSPVTRQSASNSVCINGNCFQVELAKTETERGSGLMNRASLDENKGMLFIFEKEGIYPFWMKNTLIPLDMIWIGENNKIIFIAKNAQPCKSILCPSITPSGKAKYVLEINGGLSDKFRFNLGDQVQIAAK